MDGTELFTGFEKKIHKLHNVLMHDKDSNIL
jgi:hypothetical protein